MDCFCSKPRTIHCKVVLLDEQEFFHEIQLFSGRDYHLLHDLTTIAEYRPGPTALHALLGMDDSTGQALLDVIFKHLNLLETAYFGLRYLDQDGQTHWLDPAKKLSRQLKGQDPHTLYFGVKFYAADPCKLLEEITRYQFFLQVKQDILQGRLPVSFELAAELGAYVVQSELGDYDPRRHSPGYVSEFRFLSNQTLELETRIAELHKTLVGQLPSVAELNYLDKVKWLEMYGVDLHPVLGEDNVEYFLGLTPSGITVLRNKSTVGNYYWPRISKIYFKGRYFMLRVTDKNNDESTYGFETPSKAACKHLWKCCVEHHAFFRLVQVSPTTPDIFALGSRFRYSGRTEKQAVRDAQIRARTPPSFSRTPSRRYQRRIVEGAANSPRLEENSKADLYPQQEVKRVSIPQPAQTFDSPYQATCTTTNDTQRRSDSPHSTRSAPWSQPHSRGLYNSSVPPSPRSVRSAGPRYRSSSVDSQSSNESRTCKRRKHRSRMTSDNESELSKGSGKSHRKHRRHRSRGHRKDSGSEQDSFTQKQKGNGSRSDCHYELVDSGSQWQEIQRRQTNSSHSNIQQANVISSRRSGYVNSGLETESEMSYRHRNRKHRKHRSRSRSPSDGKTWLPDELKKHLEFDLIDTSGMTESQLREIPYTVVQTNHAKHMKLKNRTKHEGLSLSDKLSHSPPPPYSPQISDSGRNKTGLRLSGESSNRTSPFQMAMNNEFVSKNVASSIASSSSNQSNSNNTSLPRMLDALGISDNCSRNSSQRSNRNSRVSSSGLFNNPGLLSNSLQETVESPRVNHEHTDSGLGGEQDSAYSNERSKDSLKHKYSTGSNVTDSKGGSVCRTPNTDYQILDPHQLYPSFKTQVVPRIKQAHNVTKPSVHKQEVDCRYGQSKASSFIFHNDFNAPSTAYHHSSISKVQITDIRSSFSRLALKSSNSAYNDNNSRLIGLNPSLQSSMRSIASSPAAAGGHDTGPLRLQYGMGSNPWSKNNSNGKHHLDNYLYSFQRTDSNRNVSINSIPASLNYLNGEDNTGEEATSRIFENKGKISGKPSPPLGRDAAEMSTEL